MASKRVLTNEQKRKNALRSKAYRRKKKDDPIFKASEKIRHKVSTILLFFYLPKFFLLTCF